jgi:Na+/H+ antiporter
MHDIEIILVLLLIVAALAYVAKRLAVPYPLLLVVGGLVLSFIPGLPRVSIAPEYVFLVFLPPLLYHAAILTSWRDFVANARPISLLAIGLTLFTTVAVAAVAHYVLPGFSWPVAFVLGAIISPPDAIAATAIARRLRVPDRVVTILEGESLVNDAIALVAYTFAIGAVITGSFSLPLAAGQFVMVVIGGIAVGYVAGRFVAWIRPKLNDPSVEQMVSLLTPYFAYIPAERLHVSGVLATVTCGLYLSRRIPYIVSPSVRMRSYAVWDAFVFLLNGLVFILIGLALPEILGRLGGTALSQAIGYAVLISAAVILVRIAWVFPATYLPRLLIPKLRERDPIPPTGWTIVVAWTGMRGIVSLAAALAIPHEISPGVAFPNRALIQVLTFGVILATLVAQGLTLPVIIRFFKVSDAGTDRRDEEVTARYLTALAAIERLDKLLTENRAPREMVARVRTPYDARLGYFSGRLADPDGERPAPACDTDESIRREALQAERAMLVKLRDDGVIGDDVLRAVQQELDLEESRIDGAEST